MLFTYQSTDQFGLKQQAIIINFKYRYLLNKYWVEFYKSSIKIASLTQNTPGGNIAIRDVYLRKTSLRNAHADRNPNRNCRW
jgi:hypothetical protein